MRIVFDKFIVSFRLAISKNVENYIFLIKMENFINILKYLKNSIFCNFEYLVDIFVCDYVYYNRRFKFSYNLNSFIFKNSLFLNYSVKLLEMSISAFKNFKSSIWLEREIYDMFGIIFFNNWDLRRILTDYTFFGFPLRKDFPLSGFMEIYYDIRKKSIFETLIELMQEFRFYIISNFIEGWDFNNT